MGHWQRREEATGISKHQLPKRKRPSRHDRGNMLVRPIGRIFGPAVRRFRFDSIPQTIDKYPGAPTRIMRNESSWWIPTIVDWDFDDIQTITVGKVLYPLPCRSSPCETRLVIRLESAHKGNWVCHQSWSETFGGQSFCGRPMGRPCRQALENSNLRDQESRR